MKILSGGSQAGTVPAGDRLGLDDDQDVLPTRPETAQSAPEEAVEEVQGRTRSLAFSHSDLLSKGENLECRVAAILEEDADGGEDGERELEHEPTPVTWRAVAWTSGRLATANH